MMRHTRPQLVNALINHPDIRPTMERGEHRIDSTEVVENLNNVVFASEHGVIVFLYKGEGVYEGHIGLLAACRGKQGLKLAGEALDRLFGQYNARKVTSAIPNALPQAKMFVRRLGFTSEGVAEDKPVENFVMEARRWAV